MRRLILLFVLGLLLPIFSFSASTVYTVETVPNTRLESNLRHVSDPDGFIPADIEHDIDTLLNGLRDKADVFVVALSSIGDASFDVFANELFNYWGIGSSKYDNGVLVLMVEDSHDFRIEPGYGLEAMLTDADCRDIVENTVFPYLRQGKYGEGILECVKRIAEVVGGDVQLTSLKSDMRAEEDERYKYGWGVANIILLIVFGLLLFKHDKGKSIDSATEEKNIARLKSDAKTIGCVGCFFPLTWILLPFFLRAPKKRRLRPRKCTCGNPMHLLSEEEEDRFLSDNQQFEEKINVKQYDVWYCDNCGKVDVYDYIQNKARSYSVCPECGCRAGKKTKTETIIKPSYYSTGKGCDWYDCEKCGHTFKVFFTIPMLVNSSSSSGSSHSGSSHSGGSFGGGRSGGGGYSGKW